MSRETLRCGGWTYKQVVDFAADFCKRYPKEAWEVLGERARAGLIDSLVLEVVLAQDLTDSGGAIEFDDIRQFRRALLHTLQTSHARHVDA